jgi:hydroxymethylpyrimidine/phosphomethylpyrimidine kinase
MNKRVIDHDKGGIKDVRKFEPKVLSKNFDEIKSTYPIQTNDKNGMISKIQKVQTLRKWLSIMRKF